MSHTSDESEDVVLSRNHSGLTLNDDGSSGGNASGGVALKKGPWTSAEDAILVDYVKKHGEGNWNAVQKHSGLFRCGKSCRLRWANHLRPNLKKGTFTAEEERLIIELHAKMGNKWARMAAHLPGRTDNEIKNYWNTRIKRRQRAGLPLYPPEVCMQAMQECQSQNTGGTTSGDKRHHGLLPISSLEIPDVIFDSLKGNQGVLSYVPEFPDISPSSLLIKGLSAPQYCSFMPPTMHRLKRFRESVDLLSGYDGNVRNELPQYQIQDDPGDKIDCSFGSSSPYDPDPATKNLLPFGAFEGSHALLNGDFSASKPTFGAVKSELPSLQYLETDLGSWGGTSLPPPLLDSVDAFIQSPPPAGTVKSECLSPRNSGLLDALLYEAKTLSSAKNHSSDKSSNSSTVTPCDLADSSTLNICQNEWEDYGESVSPLGHSATSIFSDCAPIIGSGTSLDGHTPGQTNPGCKVKTEPVDRVWTPDGEKEISTRWDVSRPDVLLGSDWLEQSAGHGKEQAVMTDAIAALLGNDSGSDYKNTGPGTSALSQAWGLGCAWNNMPAVCQMSELP